MFGGTFPTGFGSYVVGSLPTYIPDHYLRSIARLPQRSRIIVLPDGSVEGPENFNNLYSARGASFQDSEDIIQAMLIYNFLWNATGISLDNYGKKVGVNRETYGTPTDELFRKIIYTKILVNVSNGTYSNLYNIFKQLLDGDTYTQYQHVHPNTNIWTTDGSVFNESVLWNFINEAKSDILAFDIILADSDTPFELSGTGSLVNMLASAGNVAYVDFPIVDFIEENLTVTGGSTGLAGLASFEVTATLNQSLNIIEGERMYYEGDGLGGDGFYTVQSTSYNDTIVPKTLTITVVEAIVAANFDGANFGEIIENGFFADGDIITIDGTGADQVRTLDGTSPTVSTTNFRFVPTANFAVAPDNTTYANIMPEGDGLGLANEISQVNIDVQAATTLTVTVDKADLTGVIAGDLADAQISVLDGTGAYQLRTVDVNGLVSAGIQWIMTVTENFETTLDATSVINILDGGGFLAHVVTP